MQKISDVTKGRWKEILQDEFAIDRRLLNGKEQKCPKGEGCKFRFSDHGGRGNYFCACNPDGKADGFGLIQCLAGVEFKAARARIIHRYKDSAPVEPEPKDLTEIRAEMAGIFAQIRAGGPKGQVEQYLAGRGISSVPEILKQVATAYPVKLRAPLTAMCAPFYVGGEFATMHLTFIRDGKKAPIDLPRIVMTPVRDMAGGSVPLQAPVDGVLGVGEGIETSLSGGSIFEVPVHSCLNAMMLERFEPPAGVSKLLIFADNDKSFTGQAAAYALAKRLSCRPKATRISCDVWVPDRVGMDWNDALMETKNVA